MGPQHLETIVAQPYMIRVSLSASDILENATKYQGEVVVECKEGGKELHSLNDWLKSPSSGEVNLYSPLENLRFNFGENFSIGDSFYGIAQIKDPLGFHARPVAKFVKYIENYTKNNLVESVSLLSKNRSAGHSDILSILMMGLTNGSYIGIKVTGGSNPEKSCKDFTNYLNKVNV